MGCQWREQRRRQETSAGKHADPSANDGLDESRIFEGGDMRRPLGNGHAACEHTSPLCLRIVEINLGLPPCRSQNPPPRKPPTSQAKPKTYACILRR